MSPWVIPTAPPPPLVYATSDELKTTIQLEGESFADADVTLALSAASRGIEFITSRRFYADRDANQVRYYTPVSAALVRTDDIITLTELATGPGDGTFDTTWTAGSQYVLLPLNAPADGMPYNRIRARGQPLPQCPGGVRVTGMFGWQGVPDGIKQATMVLASRLMHRSREAPFGLVGFAAEAGTGSVARIARNDPDVMMLTAPFISPTLA